MSLQAGTGQRRPLGYLSNHTLEKCLESLVIVKAIQRGDITMLGCAADGRVFRVVCPEGAYLLGYLPCGGRVLLAEGAAQQKGSAEAQLQVGCYTGCRSQVICTTVWGSCGLK
ncbi:hypothetical protein MHYP_G00296010 [Metynnis hypsauchen]